MRLRGSVVLATIMLFAALPALGVTIPHNEALYKGDDARLDSRITYHADGYPVSRVLADISNATGVVMQAGIDDQDWMVYDRKIIVHVKEMKLQTLMEELSSVLHFHWSRGGEEGKWTYRLWQDKLQREEEKSLREMAQDSMTTALRQRRENALADMINLGSLSASEAAPLKESDPWRFVLATEPVGKDLAEFLDDFPEARVALLQGQEVSFPYSTLAPQLQDVVRRIAGSIESLQESIGSSATHEELMARPDRWQITVGGQLNTGKTDVVSQATLGSITIRTVGDTADMLDWPILDPSSAVAKALGRAVVGLQSGLSKETVAANLKAEMAQAAEAEDALSQPSRDITSDPALRQQITLFDQTTIVPLPTTIDAVAAASGLNIVSDYFPGKPVSIEGGNKTLGETLEKISEGYKINWTKAGGILRFTDREWFNKRAYEVPQVWIDYWMQRGKLNNGLLLEDLVQIGNLRDEQIENTIMTNRKLVGMGAGDAARNREIVRFYGSLSADQMADIAAKSLTVNTLTVEQWAALQKALASKGAVYAAAQQGEQYVRLTQSGSDIIEYKFSYHPAGGEAPVTFILRSGLVYDIADDK